MNNKFKALLTFINGLLFALLFYNERIGLNWLLFESSLLVSTFFVFKVEFKNLNIRIFGSATILTLLLFILNGTTSAFMMNIISLFLLNSSLVYNKYRSVLYGLADSFSAIPTSIKSFVGNINLLSNGSPFKRKSLSYMRITAIPLLLVCLFAWVYSLASPFFAAYVDRFTETLSKGFDWTWAHFNATFFLLILLGLALSCWFLFRNRIDSLIKSESQLSDKLLRLRDSNLYPFRILALKYELKSGVFLFATLNLLILLLNILEIKNVWIGFEWNGETLRAFVHKGTYLLIVALLMSIAVTLYFFRKNLNFYSKNKTLKILAYIWTIQNFVMIISVFVRNNIYVQHYALAYKRIGLYLFLLAAVVGLITVIYKIYQRKSAFFLIRTNALSVFLIMVLSCLFNWDIIIAKYNFAHYEHSFVHLDYLASLSDKALPYLNKSMHELEHIDEAQQGKFNLATDSFSTKEEFMNITQYKAEMDRRQKRFVKKWNDYGWLSWNYSDWKAYQRINSQ